MLRFIFALLILTSIFGEEKISTHSIKLGEETLTYTATVVSGEVSYIAYIKEGENRPITFAFNGGPGSSSVWLHMGSFGPRRIVAPEEGQTIAPPYNLIDNPETILDLTDIIFIDPMGTGLSKSETKEKEEEHYSIKGDITAVGKFIRDYLTTHRRWNSPKYIAGESYGAMRASGLAEYLQNEFGIYLNGLIFISAGIDYQTLIFDRDNSLPYFLFMPTYATTAWYHNRYKPEATLEDVAQEARDFVYETYASSIICRKCHDPEAINSRVSEMTGLPLDLVRRYQGRIREDQFASDFFVDQHKVICPYDTRMAAYAHSLFQDPSGAMITGIFSGAFHDYLHRELECPNSYTLFSYDVNGKWNYRDYNFWSYPNLMSGLRKVLIANPSLKLFVGCGYFDLATPFAATEYCFDHLDVPNVSLQMEYYEGGHMYYLNPKARTKFKQDLIRFYRN